MGSYFLLQGIVPTQGSNLGLLNCRRIPPRLSHHGDLGISGAVGLCGRHLLQLQSLHLREAGGGRLKQGPGQWCQRASRSLALRGVFGVILGVIHFGTWMMLSLPEKWFLLRRYSEACHFSPQNTVNFKIIFLADVGSGNPLQNSCLGNPMYWGAWQATVHGVAKRWTRLSHWAYIFLEFFSF